MVVSSFSPLFFSLLSPSSPSAFLATFFCKKQPHSCLRTFGNLSNFCAHVMTLFLAFPSHGALFTLLSSSLHGFLLCILLSLPFHFQAGGQLPTPLVSISVSVESNLEPLCCRFPASTAYNCTKKVISCKACAEGNITLPVTRTQLCSLLSTLSSLAPTFPQCNLETSSLSR